MAETRGNPADTYIGSLISLTSKSEIRYEGLLYTVDTEDSNIALQNVRSFGTEGRKQNGPQIPASDKVYEFIIFRGTDIKDLQVKMSPPPPSIHNDPAIISLQQAAQPSQPISAPPPPPPPPPYAPPVADLMGNASSTYKGGSVPYYLTANSNVPLWTPLPPPPGPSGNMPAYWQGYYRPQEEHRLLQPFVVPAPPPPLAQAAPSAASAASASAPALAPAPSTSGPQTLATPGQDPLAANASQSSSNQTPSQTPLLSALTRLGSSSMPEVGFSMPLAVSSSLPPSSSSTSEPCAPEHDNTDFTTQPSKSHDSKAHDSKARPLRDVRSAGPSGASSNSRSLSVPSPATQASRKSGSASGKGSMVYKQVIKQGHGVKEPLTSGHCVNMAPAAQPLLPLPVSPVQHNALFQMADRASRFNTMRRGRGRGGLGRAGRGGHSRSKVLDDFDFIAMNEKFNKEEVWDELLKVGSKERTGNGGDGSDVDYEARETGEALDHSLLEISRKSVYVKDDFFDSLSCDALDKGQGRSERPKFSEQRKIDVETFGSFQVRTYRSGGGGGYRGKRGAGGGRGGGQGRGVNRGRGHGFGFFNVNRHGDGRPRHAG